MSNYALPEDTTNALSQAAQVFESIAPQASLARRYVAGRHPLAFATEKFTSAFGNLFRAFAINYCQLIVSIIADHLTIESFALQEDADSDLSAAIARIVNLNRLFVQASALHAAAVTTGLAAAIVWPNEQGIPIIHVNAGDQIVPVHDDDRDPFTPAAAVKLWTQGQDQLLITVYLPDRIEKYFTHAHGASVTGVQSLLERPMSLQRRIIPGEPWPLPNPLNRPPVVFFYNGPDRSTPFSEIAHIIPLQDALNKTWADLLVAMEFQAIPLRWVAGLDIDIDPETGQPRMPFSPGADRLWAVPYEGARFGQFQAADLSPFLTVASGIVQHIAAISKVPVHYLIPPTAIWPSGESLWASMQGFARYIAGKQTRFGAAWADTINTALQFLYGPSFRANPSVLWKQAAPVRDVELYSAQILKSKLGVPFDQLLREIGYPQHKVQEFMERLAAEQAQDEQEESGTTREATGEFIRTMPNEIRPFLGPDASALEA